MARVLKEKIGKLEKIAPEIFKMTIKSAYVAKNAQPGQFVNIRCSDGTDMLLRRPFSISGVDCQRGYFDVIFEVRGKGTANLAEKKPGEYLDFMGPLGNGFDTSGIYKKIAVVGGGIGIFPLLYILKKMNTCHRSVFIGFKNKDKIVLNDEFRLNSEEFCVSTEDGSTGFMGMITYPLEECLQKKKFDIIYACGPVQMLKKVVQLSKINNIKCQVSLEERMGCGIGACLVCACKTKYGEGWQYSHVCKDGPVFWGNEVIFED